MKSVVGIDEVGRGPLAGPVAVGSFWILNPEFHLLVDAFAVPLHDSKQLSRTQRETWFRQLESWREEGKCDFAVAMTSAEDIDKHGISKGIKKALAETLYILECGTDCQILLDGSLKAPSEYTKQITIIKGDEKEMAIALASIVAKVTRDNHMLRLAKRYPQYGFERHMGYGTEEHYTALRKHGLTPIHRKSFLKNLKGAHKKKK